jgi:protoporphyrinogen oxidase
MSKKAIIIGAGPAGLTAAYELLKRTDIKPIILEKSGDIGGISKTINYKGNRMDIGGHRFFSKSDRVMKWWLNIMPLEKTNEDEITIKYQNKTHAIYNGSNKETDAPVDPGRVMLIRKRLSRIYFLRKFFNYPIQLSIDTLRKLGFIRTIRILLSYLLAQFIPRKPEKSLEDFLINRFGSQLYLLFFKDYTEKVWGVPCHEISAEWGAQRIKGVSISKAIQHAAQMMVRKKNTGDVSQKDTETSLIEQFFYPALGPGQLWEEVARKIEILGGTIIMHQDVNEIRVKDNKITGVVTTNSETGETTEYKGEYFFSTMPVQELIAGMNGSVPNDVKKVAEGLQYRDFITVGVLLEKLCTTDLKTGEKKNLNLKDTWIYIQEKDVKVGRLQLFNNWSPYMVNKPGNVWIGMEYFCNKGDGFWELSDEEIQRTAIAELEKMGLAQVQDVLDSTVHKIEKTYPAYFGTYNEFDKIKDFVDQYENLFLVGRNGMHKYNNSDHSMLTAMTAVDNICEGVMGKANVWAINTEQEYHEEKKTQQGQEPAITESENYHAMQTTTALTKGSFKDFVFKEKENKKLLYFAGIAMVIMFAIFKYLYPFPSFIFADSYVYIQTAFWNSPINIYPVGYSNFLRLISVFTTSDTAAVAVQYLVLQASLLFFMFTIFYFFNPGIFVKRLLFAFALFNPVYLYLANLISSDCLFISLSLIWFTLLIWIIARPNNWLMVLQVAIFFMVFTVRYNAMYYPVITTFALLFSRQRWMTKVAGVAACILVISIYIWNTKRHYYELTGTHQFTAFTGWQMANNALHAYRPVESKDRKPVPAKFKELDQITRTYFDTTRNILKYPHELILAGTFYMWSPPSPLQQYVIQKYKMDSTEIPVNLWAEVGPLYYDYGLWLIRQYPENFMYNYILPNMAKFYSPPVEFLEKYNTEKPTVTGRAMQWFRYKSEKIKKRVPGYTTVVLNFLPPLNGCLNALFLISLIFFGMLKGFMLSRNIAWFLKLTLFFWLVNFGFSVFASPISLRFQIFPMMIILASTSLMVEYIVIAAFWPAKLNIYSNGVPNLALS